jgi:hypothetical protein
VLLAFKIRRNDLITKYDIKLQILSESEKIVKRIVFCSKIVSDLFTNILMVHERSNGGNIFRKNNLWIYFCMDTK